MLRNILSPIASCIIVLGMSAADLKSWMKANRKSVLQVAVLLHVHSQTVYKFLRGHEVAPVIYAAIVNLVKSQPERAVKPPAKV
jgi:hypothetical protein